ncbi:MAG TPA: lactate utilization protein C [Candidatus Janibacter merdipullorum]|nr:lactate utilization protein C [Candidatus Janibacter merdipullorum]
MTAREEILAAVRAAADGAPRPAPADEPTPATSPDRAEMLDRFVERVEDYRARVIRCTPPELTAQALFALGEAERVLLPEGLPEAVVTAVTDRLGPASVSIGDLPDGELEAFDAVVTTSAAAIAETGTVVLDHASGQGRRALSLLPDRHVCIVRTDQVVADVPQVMRRLDPLRPQTWISGPSATSDIELQRVEGVHGPRTLTVVLAGN